MCTGVSISLSPHLRVFVIVEEDSWAVVSWLNASDLIVLQLNPRWFFAYARHGARRVVIIQQKACKYNLKNIEEGIW